MKEPADCVNILIETNNAACILPHFIALQFVNNYTDSHGNPILRISGLSLRYELMAYVFEKASPYVDKFNWVYQQILEYALHMKWDSENFRFKTTKDSALESSTVLTQFLLIIMLIGFCLGIVVFLYELVVHRYTLRRY